MSTKLEISVKIDDSVVAFEAYDISDWAAILKKGHAGVVLGYLADGAIKSAVEGLKK